MADLRTLDNDLNQLILQGKAMDAFEKYYGENVVMQENTDEPRRGKAANRQAELDFFGSVEKVNAFKLISSAIGDEVTFSEWEMDISFKGGNRAQYSQVARRRWKDGQIVEERFYHK